MFNELDSFEDKLKKIMVLVSLVLLGGVGLYVFVLFAIETNFFAKIKMIAEELL